MKHRPERVSKLIMDELNKLILRHVEIPGALITVTDVEVLKDLSQAKIRFSALPSEKSETALKILGRASKELQYLLLKKLNIKPMPQIVFEIDYGLEKAAKVEKILLEENKKF